MKLKVVQPIFAESASELIRLASSFSQTILLKKEHWVVDAKSLLGVLALSLQPGEEIELSVNNGDETEIAEAFLKTNLFEQA